MAWDGKNFYSVFTGQKIRVGKVPPPPRKICKPLTRGWDASLYDRPIKFGRFFLSDYVGKTAAFYNLINVIDLATNHSLLYDYRDKFKLVAVKVKFNSDCHVGWYGLDKVFAGSSIESIEILKTFEN